MEKRIFEIIESVMGHNFSGMDRNAKINTFETWDSFNNLMLISELQEEYGVEFNAAEVNSVQTLHELLTLVEKKVKERNA